MANANTYKQWNAVADKVLRGSKLSAGEVTRYKAAVKAWPGAWSLVLNTGLKFTVNDALVRNQQKKSLLPVQVRDVRAMQKWVRAQYSKLTKGLVGLTEVYQPPEEARYPTKKESLKAFMESLGATPPIPNSVRWKRLRPMLMRNNYALINAYEMHQLQLLHAAASEARVGVSIYEGMIAVMLAIISIANPAIGIVLGLAGSGMSASMESNMSQYTNAVENALASGEPLSMGLVKNFRIPASLSIAFAQAKVASDSDPYIRARNEQYLKDVGAPLVPGGAADMGSVWKIPGQKPFSAYSAAPPAPVLTHSQSAATTARRPLSMPKKLVLGGGVALLLAYVL